MSIFKINGERNSGTNFLEKILKINNFSVYVHKVNIKKKTIQYWKHGVPTDNQKNINNKVIDIFIFRELKSWLVSMFKNPYELENNFRCNFKLFLEKKQSSNNYWINENNEILNMDDNDKDIFEIRKHKFNEICKYRDNNKNIIFVNLTYLQNENNLLEFLNILNDNYVKNNKREYILKIPHTKTKSNDYKNNTYNINIDEYIDIINSKKNNEIEDFINNLTYIIK